MPAPEEIADKQVAGLGKITSEEHCIPLTTNGDMLDRVVPQMLETFMSFLLAVNLGVKTGLFERIDDTSNPTTADEAIEILARSTDHSFHGALLESLEMNEIVKRQDNKILPTSLSRTLMPGKPGTSNVRFFSNFVALPAMAGVIASKKLGTGQTYFQAFHGLPKDTGLFQYLERRENSEHRRDFGITMKSLSQDPKNSPDEVLRQFDWSGVKIVIDGGGSNGDVCRRIAETLAPSQCRFIVQDLAGVVEDAHEHHARQPESTIDISFEVRDLFEPDDTHNFDVYLICRTIHDYTDEDARRILESLTANMRKGQKLLILDAILDKLCDARSAAINNSMIVTTLLGSHERTLSEWKALISSVSTKLVIKKLYLPQTSMVCMIEVERE